MRSSLAKRALLEDVLRLCTVLGREAAERAELLLKLGTFLNDPDWELRATLFDQLPHVAAFFGPVATRKMIVPFVQQHLADAVERVVSRALECVVRLVDATGPELLTTELELELAAAAAPLLLHPHRAIRNAAIRVQCAVLAVLHFPDAHVLLLPKLEPYLAREIVEEHVDYSIFSAALLPPFDEAEYRALIVEAELGGASRGASPRGGSGSSASERLRHSGSAPNSPQLGGASSPRAPSATSSPREGDLPHLDLATVPPADAAAAALTLELEQRRELMLPYARRVVSMSRSSTASATSRRSSVESRSGSSYAAELAAMVGAPAAIFVPEQHDAMLRVEKVAAEPTESSTEETASRRGAWSNGEDPYFGRALSHGSYSEAGVCKERQNYAFVVQHASDRKEEKESAAALAAAPPSDSGIASAGSLPRLVHAEHFQLLVGALGIPPLPPRLGGVLGSGQRARRSAHARSWSPLQLWRPTQLVHTLHEHRGAIRAIATSDAHQFVLTGGDDGVLRAWSMRSMLDAITVRSSAQYDVGSPIVDLAMVGESQRSVVHFFCFHHLFFCLHHLFFVCSLALILFCAAKASSSRRPTRTSTSCERTSTRASMSVRSRARVRSKLSAVKRAARS